MNAVETQSTDGEMAALVKKEAQLFSRLAPGQFDGRQLGVGAALEFLLLAPVQGPFPNCLPHAKVG
jgi:hypothetical protein